MKFGVSTYPMLEISYWRPRCLTAVVGDRDASQGSVG